MLPLSFLDTVKIHSVLLGHRISSSVLKESQQEFFKKSHDLSQRYLKSNTRENSRIT